MRQMRVLTMLMMPLTILLTNCAGIPKVTMYQLDLVNNQVNARRITKYNEQTCKLEVVPEPSFPLFPPGDMHGAICFTPKDAARIKAKAESDCINARDNKKK